MSDVFGDIPILVKKEKYLKEKPVFSEISEFGAPVTQDFCDRIGADCYTSDSSSAADAAEKYLKKCG